MSANYELIYDELHQNLEKISERVLKPCISFAKRWKIGSTDKWQRINDDSLREYRYQRRKIMTKENIILLFGDTSAGKSTLINAILRQNHLPNRCGRTTNCFIEIRKSSTNRTYWTLNNQEKEQDIESLAKMVNYTSDNPLPDGTRVKVFYSNDDCPILEDNTVIVDTPGIDTDEKMDEYVVNSCSEGNLIVLVVNSINAINETMKSFIQRSSTIFSKLNFILIYNHWDEFDDDDDRDDLEQQLVKDANKLFIECLRIPAGLEKEKIFFISAKEQLEFNENNQYYDDDVLRKNRHQEFNRLSDKLQEEIKERYECMKDLLKVQLDVFDECRTNIAIIEDEIPTISLNYFDKMKEFEKSIKSKIQSVSNEWYDRFINGVLREDNRGIEDIIGQSDFDEYTFLLNSSYDKFIPFLQGHEIEQSITNSIEPAITRLLEQSYNGFQEDLTKEIYGKGNKLIKDFIRSLSEQSSDEFIKDLLDKINNNENSIRQSIDSMSDELYSEFCKKVLDEVNRTNINNLRKVIQLIYHNSYEYFNKYLPKEINSRYNKMIKESIESFLKQWYKNILKDLLKEVEEWDTQDSIKSVVNRLFEKLTKAFFIIYDKYFIINKELIDNIVKVSFNKFEQELVTLNSFMETKKSIESILKQIFENLTEELISKIKFDTFDFVKRSIETLSKPFYDNLNQDLLKKLGDTFVVSEDFLKIKAKKSYDNLIRKLFSFIINKHSDLLKEIKESLTKQPYDKLKEDLSNAMRINSDFTLKEWRGSILNQFSKSLEQDLIRGISSNCDSVMKDSIESLSKPFYDNLCETLVTEICKTDEIINIKSSRLIHLFNEVRNICNDEIKHLIWEIINKYLRELTQGLLEKMNSEEDEAIKESIEFVLKKSQENLINDLIGVIRTQVDFFLRRNSMNKLLKRISSDYLTDIKENVKKIISQEGNEDQMFIVENLYFPNYLELCFPNIDHSNASKMNSTGNKGFCMTVGVASVAVGTAVAAVSLVAAPLVALGGSITGIYLAFGVGKLTERAYNTKGLIKRHAEWLCEKDEKTFKDEWENFTDEVVDSYSLFLSNIQYDLFELFEREK